MNAQWFLRRYPPSLFVIEGELRSVFWRAGYGDIWFTCTRAEPPFACLGLWQGRKFEMEWDPGSFLIVRMSEPESKVLEMFERVLGHRALAGYRDGENKIALEWRSKNADERFQKLEASGVRELERLNR